MHMAITLDRLHCHDEGDGSGNAEPYLWPVFFKVDGQSYAYNPGVGLIGQPIVVSTTGHRGNLGNGGVDAGSDVDIPPAVGRFRSEFRPIPVHDPAIARIVGENLPAIAGVVVVVMEKDAWPDRLATDGYVALVDAVKLAVVKVTESLQHALRAPTPEEIAALVQGVKDQAAAMVHAAVKDSMDAWNLLWFGTLGDGDDQIGSEAFTVTSQQLRDSGVVQLRKRWPADAAEDGDWELLGQVQRLPLTLRQYILAQGMRPRDGARAAMGQERSMHECLNR
ncbi:hypothetical protein ACQEVF_43970 [Nonomuraea polychroma]|uniref:hypothetical protein n=1 Tax=Nonomuraea polychroma TaxID=46176 RepID=UPI003D924AEE